MAIPRILATVTPRFGLLLVPLASFNVACSDSAPIAQPAAPTSVSAPNAFTEIAGTVVDTALRPLAGVTVEIVSGSQAGQSAVSNAEGSFVFSGGTYANGISYRASKDGYATNTVTGPLMFPTPSTRAALLVTL